MALQTIRQQYKPSPRLLSTAERVTCRSVLIRYGLTFILCSWNALLSAGAREGETQDTESSPPDPARLIQQVNNHYRSAATYRAEGKALTRILQPESGTETAVGVSFRMWLGRPGLYRIEWTEHRNLGKTESGAVWNDGDGPYLYLGTSGGYTRMSSDPIALAAATGVSLGVAHTIPSLFFEFRDTTGLLDRLQSPVLEASEVVDETPCHVVAASLPSGLEYRLWISKDEPILIQVENLLGGSSETDAVPESTPEQEVQALRALGLDDTEANRDRIRASLQQARELMKQIRGTAKQLHQDIRMSVPLATEAFAFQVPEGVTNGLDIAGAELSDESGR